MNKEIERKIDEYIWNKDINALLDLIKENDSYILINQYETQYGDIDNKYKGTNCIGFLAAFNYFDLVKELIVKYNIILSPNVYKYPIQQKNIGAIDFFINLGVNIDCRFVDSEIFQKYVKFKKMQKILDNNI
jgi:hypothetical protein